MNNFSGETIWLIGASSGIGEALARELSERGAHLILSARRQQSLETLNNALGGHHHVEPLDVADIDQVEAAKNAIQAKVKEVHRVIFLAALYKPVAIESLDMSAVKALLAVNLTGAIAVTKASLALMKHNSGSRICDRKGQIVLCASVAGMLGLPHGQPYSASKAALINFAQSLYAEQGDQLDVKLVNPGFVSTPLTSQNKFHMPMVQTPEKAAQHIVKGLNSQSFEIHFPKLFTCAIKTLSLLPYGLMLPVLRRFRP